MPRRPPPTGALVQLEARVPQPCADAVTLRAHALGVTRSAMLRAIVSQWCDRQDPGEAGDGQLSLLEPEP